MRWLIEEEEDGCGEEDKAKAGPEVKSPLSPPPSPQQQEQQQLPAMAPPTPWPPPSLQQSPAEMDGLFTRLDYVFVMFRLGVG